MQLLSLRGCSSKLCKPCEPMQQGFTRNDRSPVGGGQVEQDCKQGVQAFSIFSPTLTPSHQNMSRVPYPCNTRSRTRCFAAGLIESTVEDRKSTHLDTRIDASSERAVLYLRNGFADMQRGLPAFDYGV